MMPSIPERLAAYVGVWAVRRVFGLGCATDVRDDFPNDPTAQCIQCDAARVVAYMKSVMSGQTPEYEPPEFQK
jgi:hypothetical protein